VAEGLRRVSREEGKAVPYIRAETCVIGGLKLQRIALGMQDEHNRPLEVHVYEGYWAPLAEGKVNIMDVMSFLLRGGVHGLANARKEFSRWLFGGFVNFGRRPRTGLLLTSAALVVLGLIVANFLVTVAFADRIWESAKNRTPASGKLFEDDTFFGLTSLVGYWLVYTAMLGVLCALTHRFRLRTMTIPLNLLLAGWVLYTALSFLLVPALVVAGQIEFSWITKEFFKNYVVFIWIGLLAVTYALRKVMLQYSGAVAAYISTDTADRLKIRGEIRDAIRGMARAIYASKEYEAVVWVGHSLGSVMAYDALNALIMDDELTGGQMQVVKRTQMLITIGSPLDKIAFFFDAQSARATQTREALAASFQPLICDYERFRSIPWVNIWSPADMISGALDFFDDLSKSRGREVRNLVDPLATTPLLAHVEYWENPLLFEQIYAGVTRQDVAAAVAR